ncbi:MAG: hypothetical protein MJ093_09550 [Saccharofermentans sp.]|nr:hypothetical protein [Saccharofermentans sp.]
MSKTDKALIFSAISLVIFTISMEVMWYITGAIPEALVVSFFTAFGFEAGFCVRVYRISKDGEKKGDEEDENIP